MLKLKLLRRLWSNPIWIVLLTLNLISPVPQAHSQIFSWIFGGEKTEVTAPVGSSVCPWQTPDEIPLLSTFFKDVEGLHKHLGPLNEGPNIRGVILADPDDPEVRESTHDRILSELPAKTKAIVVTQNQDYYKKKFPHLIKNGQLFLFNYKTNSVWVRDYFPEMVINNKGKLEWVQFEYYTRRVEDGHLGETMAKNLNIPIKKVPLMMEGGNILIDDQKRLFLSEKVMNENMKYKKMTLKQVEDTLKDALKVKSVHWVQTYEDDELAHIDMYAKFLGGNKVLVADSHVPERKLVLEAMSVKMKNAGLQVARIHNADHVSDRPHIIRTFTNALIVGNKVYLPTYHDEIALDDIGRMRQKAFDEAKSKYEYLGFEVAPIDCRMWINLQGAVHCQTKHIP